MPATLIGRHAVMHIEWALEMREWWAQWRQHAFAFSARPSPHAAQMERHLREILEGGLHRRVNVELGKLALSQDNWRSDRPVPYRMLLGSHDIADFAARMARWPAARELVADLAAIARHG